MIGLGNKRSICHKTKDFQVDLTYVERTKKRGGKKNHRIEKKNDDGDDDDKCLFVC
jgi:hypothetical protein